MTKIIFVTFYDQFSFGLRILSSLLRESGHEAKIIYFHLPYSGIIEVPNNNPISGEIFVNWQLKEYAKSNTPWTENEVEILIRHLKRESPDIIGISNRSPLDKPILPVLERIRKVFPDKLIIAGGYGPFLNPELYLQHVDFVVFGESEHIIVDIANKHKNINALKNIQNMIYLEGGELRYSEIIEPENNLDNFPIPGYDDNKNVFIDNDRLFNRDPVSVFDPTVDTYPLIVGRGCVRQCSYCSAGQWKKLYYNFGSINIKPQRVRSINHILKELKEAKSRGYKYISILESHLTGSSNFLIEFFKKYKQEIDLPFTAYLHPDQIVSNPQILCHAIEAGLKKCPIGIQHGSQKICEEYFHRHIDNRTILKFAQLLDDKGIKSEYQFIAGLPFETDKTLFESYEFVKKLPTKHSFLMISRLKCFPMSPLEKLLLERNISFKINIKEWYFTALLYLIRVIVGDDIFVELWQYSRKLIQGSNDISADKEQFFIFFADLLFKNKKTLFEDKNLLVPLYRGYLTNIFNPKGGKNALCDQSVLLVIDKGYSDYIELFRGKSFDSLVFGGLQNSTAPLFSSLNISDINHLSIHNHSIIFILSKNKKIIYKKIEPYLDNTTFIP